MTVGVTTSPPKEYYRVLAFGHGHGALISERFSRDAAERCRREWQDSMPDADADGWPVRNREGGTDGGNEYER